MQNDAVRVVARVVAKSDKVEELRALLRGLLEPTRKERGCVTYELLQNKTDPTDFTFVEEWASDAAVDAHLQTPHVQRALAKLPDLAAAAPDIRRYAG
jgi:quinol monooxygenase YgiN